MTKQEILDMFSDINFAYNNSSKHETLEMMLDELLEEREVVVRCKDCKYLIDHYGYMNDGYCANMRDKYGVKFKPDKDWFCADGERAETKQYPRIKYQKR